MNVAIWLQHQDSDVKSTPFRSPHRAARVAEDSDTATGFVFDGASCSACGDLSAPEFAGWENLGGYSWPMVATERFVREELTHYGCGGRVHLIDVRRA